MTAPTFTPGSIAVQKRDNPLGLAAMIMGIVAMVCAVLPFVSFLAWFPGLIAIGLGIPGVIIADRKRVAAIVGIILGTLALAVGAIFSVGSIAVLVEWINNTSA
jgi:thiamine transporter ThiT